jgi:hypothetical protein
MRVGSAYFLQCIYAQRKLGWAGRCEGAKRKLDPCGAQASAVGQNGVY